MVVRKEDAYTIAVNRIVDKDAIATERERIGVGQSQMCRTTIKWVKSGGRTWVGGKADYLGTSKAVTVVALWTNKEGRDIAGRGIPPALETGNVYVLSERVSEGDL